MKDIERRVARLEARSGSIKYPSIREEESHADFYDRLKQLGIPTVPPYKPGFKWSEVECAYVASET